MSDYFDTLERELRQALRRHTHLPWYARLRLRYPRTLLAAVACLIIGGPALAAAFGVLHGKPSAPPTGRFTIPGAEPSAAASGYSVSATPDLQGGGVGWCLTFHLFFKVGAAQGGGCGWAPLPGREIIAFDGGSGFTRSTSGTATETNLEFLTTSQVAAVRVSSTLTILTRADPQLPDHYRIAIETNQATTGAPSQSSRPTPPNPRAAVALNRTGQRIGLPFSPSTALHDATVYWQPGRTVGVGPQPKVHHPPAAACEIDTAALVGVHLFFGWVVPHVRGFPDLASKTFLSCASTQFGYGHGGFIAAILLDAQHPGATPEPLPGATPVPEHPQTFNEPAITPPQGTRPSGINSQSITARRIGKAWLIVQSSGSITQRLTVLDHLQACVRLTGALCPAAS